MIQNKYIHLLREVYDAIMHKPSNPQKLAEDILGRSKCAVQVGAVIADRHGIFSWGWNNEGLGFGLHAESHAIGRANHKRLVGASIYVAGQRKRNGRIVNSRPCEGCLAHIYSTGIKRIYYRDSLKRWRMEYAAETP